MDDVTTRKMVEVAVSETNKIIGKSCKIVVDCITIDTNNIQIMHDES